MVITEKESMANQEPAIQLLIDPPQHDQDGEMEQSNVLGNQPAINSFFKNRNELINREKQHRSDHEFRQSLSTTAQQACKIVSRIRDEERDTIWKTEGNPELNQDELFPGMMFNVAKGHMESTRLWKIVRKMPKGTLLHAHIGATIDLEWLFTEAINTPGMCISSPIPLDTEQNRGQALLRFQFSSESTTQTASIWSSDYLPDTMVSLSNAASTFPNEGQTGFVTWVKNRCSITKADTLEHHLGVDDVWRKLTTGFRMLGPIIYYEPILRRFLRKLFLTLLEDGVRWAELRAVFSSSFTLEGQDLPNQGPGALLRVLNEEITRFVKSDEGKGFWGARMIWTTMRHLNTAAVIEDMRNCIEAKKQYPHLIAGYDVVGPEDLGRTLHDLTPELLWFQKSCAEAGVEIPFFFHAGECLGDGDSTDQNLYDAILFGSRRLGHAFSLYKHPVLINIVKDRKILVECCPISNEALRYTASIMSHPLPALLSRGVAAALSNDDPALLGQETSGLTHDFWQVLQGWENLGLAGLGSLAQNSVRWAVFVDQTTEDWLKGIDEGSAGTSIRAERMRLWNVEWERFCGWVVDEFGTSS